MIIEELFKGLLWLLIAVITICSLGIFATWAASVAESTATVGPIMGRLYHYLFDLGAWLPGQTLALGLGSAVVILTSAYCIKLGRVLLSLLTGGGGSAA